MTLPPSAESVSAPVPLDSTHDLSGFDCGVAALDDWLRRRAQRNASEGASRTYVAAIGASVVGYYCLASGAVMLEQATGRVRRNQPDPVPVIVMGRLAVDRRHAGRGIGSGLLKDAVARTLEASRIIGVRALLLHAKDENARNFYLKWGFAPSPVHPLTLMATLPDLVQALG